MAVSLIINSYAISQAQDLDDFAGLIAWYRSGEGVTINTTPSPDILHQWNDQSGNGHHLGTPSANDGLDVNPAAQNGLDTYGPTANAANVDILSTDDLSTEVAEANLAPNGSASLTLVAVLTRPAAAGGAICITNGTGFVTVADLQWSSSTAIQARAREAGVMSSTPSETIGDTDYHTFMAVIQPSGIELYVDGILEQSNNSITFAPITGSDRNISVNGIGPNTNPSTNIGGEYAVYNQDRGADAVAIHNILAARWGL